MRLTHFFIDRPRFATVLSAFVTLIGLGALAILPVAQYPEIVPPTVQITTVYPGASADTVARTVATPLEQAINGVENMDYISSQSTGNGQLTITVIFKIGTSINTALKLTHNRVQDTLSRLPQEVQLQSVQVKKTIPALLLGVHPYSPDGSRSAEHISNYFILHVRDEIARLPGVSDFWILGERQCDADLDRSGQGRCERYQRQRYLKRPACSEHPSLGRRPQSAACVQRLGRRLPDECPRTWTSHHA